MGTGRPGRHAAPRAATPQTRHLHTWSPYSTRRKATADLPRDDHAAIPDHAPPQRKHVTVISGRDNHVKAPGKRRILCRRRDPRDRRINGPLERRTSTYQTFELVKAVGE